MGRVLRVAIVALCVTVALQRGAIAQNLAFVFFERYLEPLRVAAGIPGLSAAIVQDGDVVWESALGHADLESNIRTRADTPYDIGDLTQVFTTILLAKCAERGAVQPEHSIRRWVPAAPDPPATIRQILGHASGASGGYKYDPGRFALLTSVVESCMNKGYRQALADEVLDQLGMRDTVPGRDLASLPILDGNRPTFDQSDRDRYAAVLQRLATPYKVDRRGRATRAEPPPPTIDASHGLIATVRDLARFDRALDDDLVRADMRAQIWTSGAANGVTLPTGMGWFIQTYEGHRLVWHFGLVRDAYSALILKVPARRLTLILLANSDGLSAPFALENGDVTTSLFARTFLRVFL
jgi:CubicO group peptidase (beta-lactamase class C family)